MGYTAVLAHRGDDVYPFIELTCQGSDSLSIVLVTW